jgi:putative N-acetylmannosamine-6-phosphate epimerase/predicted NBD/HSP70 family sugar kinase
MTVDDFLSLLRESPLVASVQTNPGSAVDDPLTLARLAQASVDQGVRLLRLQGSQNIATVRSITHRPCIGLIKRDYADSEVYITATVKEVQEVIDAGAEIVAIDGTPRPRPSGTNFKDLVDFAHAQGRLVLADIDNVESAVYAQSAGADFISTTLAGYTSARPASSGADLDLLREVVQQCRVPVLAEGRYAHRWEVESALRIGAVGVIVGGVLNDPVKQTRALMPSRQSRYGELVGAVDIGGTWLRYGMFSPDWKLLDSVRIANTPQRKERLEWIREQIERTGAGVVGVSTGGIVDPRTGEVWTAKEYLMPDHIGIRFSQETLGVPTFAHGDGHATAWAHACLAEFAGSRVATLALGTGVGCGFVREGTIWCGRRGEYPRINDLPAPGGMTYEDLLGGRNLIIRSECDTEQAAISALEGAVHAITHMYFPDHIVIAGSVGLSDWLQPRAQQLGLVPSPFGTDAGLYGAAALALFPVH